MTAVLRVLAVIVATLAAVLLAAVILAAIIATLAAVLLAAVILRALAPAGPRACQRPALPSGDQKLISGVIWTCTDGTWHAR